MSEQRSNVVSINTPTSPVAQFEIEMLFETLLNQYILPKINPAVNSLADYVSEKQLTAASDIDLMQLIETGKKVKRSKAEIVESFTNHLFNNVSEWTEAKKTTDTSQPDNDLCLVDNTTLEKNLAWQAAARQMEMCEQVQNLYNCESRLQDFTPSDSIPSDSIPSDSIPSDSIPSDSIPSDSTHLPIGSMALCEAFASALVPLNLDVDTAQEFLSLFAKHVKFTAAQMWQQADTDLSGMGLELNTPKVSSYTETVASTNPKKNTNQEAADSDTELVNQIAQQVVSRVESMIGQQFNKTLNETGADSFIISATSYPTEDLTSTLTSIQNELSEQTSSISNLSDSIKHELINRGITQNLSPRQEDLINFVGLLFEYIIDDHELPDIIKNIIGLLQIPVLKLALIDHDFLSNREHPGRQLLNDMTSAGMHCKESDEPVVHLIENTVKTIIRSFTDNPNIFSECLDEFNKELLSINKCSIQTVEDDLWNTDSAEEAILNTPELTKEYSEPVIDPASNTTTASPVDDIVDSYLTRHNVPKSLNDLVCSGWKDVLQLALEQGSSDEDWFHRVNTLDMLLWNLQENRQNNIPDDDWQILKNYLLDQFNEVEINPFAVAEWLHSIDSMTNKHIGLEEEIVIQKQADQQQNKPTVETDEIRESEFPEPEIDLSISDTLPQPFPDTEMPVVGQWVEFIGKNDHRLRCKLATINCHTDRYVFVNKSGMKVAEWSGPELEKSIQNNRVELLDNQQFFDRALQAVMNKFLKF
ncbi:DUF1631 domain-containing protein [Endozoicomonas gorgoniicola]|uniref:DUF1631 domain-containing protein n=1 Tax=Endozoicomonas gorgoniicola TaxID=1234144 RepID=A0ABT3N580_9GAMM|nr:DUF1631 domain-containing protein [Endozoicomonas gorgoniicola]MCW7556364.1 DUF1631 domain-containing protein [Endozoicomonas gorgoniicola]